MRIANTRLLSCATALQVLCSLPTLAQTHYPLTLDNCGMTVTIDAAPQRVITIKSTTTEMLIALGLSEHIIGIAFQDGPAPEPWANMIANLPVLSDKLPAQEVVLETEPDFLYGGWESNFAADGVGERTALARMDIATYVSPAACRSVKPAKLTFDAVFAEITEIGAIFDVGTSAESLIATQKLTLQTITPDSRNLTALWYSSGIKTPYVGAGSGAPAMMMEALGLHNIMADSEENWIPASWEAIVDANPDVIILVDAAWNSVEQKKRILLENPITSKLDAVVNQRYLILPFPASEAGIRNVDATVSMSRQLADLSFSP